MSTQLSIDFARAQRDRGIALAELGAANAVPDWSSVALDYLRLYATRHAARFTAEDVLDSIPADNVLQDANPKAWGAVFQRAARQGIIAKDGTSICRKRHASICVAWRSLIAGGRAA